MTEQYHPNKVSKTALETFPDKAYLFDVDGVLTEPQTRRVEQPALFNELIKRLKSGMPVGLNTGRSLDFMIKEVLDPLESKITDKTLLQNIIAIGEKGAAWITYDVEGNRRKKIDENISVPRSIQDEVKSLISQPQFSDTMFLDDTKHTMVSVEELPVERRKGTHENFKSAQKNLVSVLRQLIIENNLQSELKVDPTRIATDVENKHVGKALGARKFVEILEERRIKPQKYIGFGDSSSDIEMHEELRRLGKNTQFVFVGGREHLSDKDLEGVVFTDKHADRGTLDFLQSENR